jgi:DNA-binding MarR family transcriptional regulator
VVAELDQLLLDPTRLAIVSLLAAAEWAEFWFVRDSVNLSDSALSKQVTTLSRNDYVQVRKGYVGKRPRTWLNLTDTGRDNLAEHISALQAIAEKARSDGAKQPRDPSVP